jgi:uncharacterized protein
MKFRNVFKNRHVILPVIHTLSVNQAERNAAMAFDLGADGVFLINHSISPSELLDILARIRIQFPDKWFGVNCLGFNAHQVLETVDNSINGVWTDNAGINEEADDQDFAEEVKNEIITKGWDGLYFGGVAFKYQRTVKNPAKAAKIASNFMDVVTTSGPGTGQPAEIEKVIQMKEAIGDFPLAVASGVTPDNAVKYLPYIDCILVATGISKGDFHNLNYDLTKKLIDNVRSYR